MVDAFVDAFKDGPDALNAVGRDLLLDVFLAFMVDDVS